MFGGTRRFLALVSLCALCGCTGTTDPTPRAQPPDPTTTTTSTTTTSTSTTTTPEPDTDTIEFQPLPADPDLTTEQQIEAAYLHHWEVLLAAYRQGDAAPLSLIYVGEALETRTAEIERLAGDGHLVRGEVSHNYAVTVLADDFGIVIDEMTNNLERVVRTSDVVIDPATSDPLLVEFRLRKVADQWLVEHVSQLASES